MAAWAVPLIVVAATGQGPVAVLAGACGQFGQEVCCDVLCGVAGRGPLGVREHERGEHGDELGYRHAPLSSEAFGELFVCVGAVITGKDRARSFNSHLPHQ